MVHNSKPLSEDIIVHNRAQIPQFCNEDEEFEYWATHSLGDELLAEAGTLPEDVIPQHETQVVPLRLNAETLARLQALAKRQHKREQTLLREIVEKRLAEEEQRSNQTDAVEGDLQAPARRPATS